MALPSPFRPPPLSLQMAVPAFLSVFLLPPLIIAELHANLDFWPTSFPKGIISINDAMQARGG